MTNEAFYAHLNELDEEANDILEVKGPDYAGHGEDNRLANFETVAGLLKGAPIDAMTIAAVYWLKHVFAICTFVRTRKEGSEPMMGRWADERNYNALMWACYQDLPSQKPRTLTKAPQGEALAPFDLPGGTSGAPDRPRGGTAG